MFEIKSDNPNYLASVVKLGAPQPVPNADKLQSVVVNGCSVITGLTAKEGDLYIYFPIESAINKDFLSYSNSFQDVEMNRDKTVKGFFVKTGRVRAIKLRGKVSEGYIVPARDFNEWLQTISPKQLVNFITPDLVGTEFDTFKGVTICEKYTIPVKASGTQTKADKKIKRESKLVDNQFRLSLDLEHLKRNIHKINLEDRITISYKMHGANASMGRVLCKRPLSWVEKLLKRCSVRVEDTQYDLVYAS